MSEIAGSHQRQTPCIKLDGDAGYVLDFLDKHFRSVFQPICALNGECFGYEALLRVYDADGSAIRPDLFFKSIADNPALCLLLDQWSRELHFKNFQLLLSPCCLFVNVFPNTLVKEQVGNIHHHNPLVSQDPQQRVYIEVVEDDCEDLHALMESAKDLRVRGYHIALDDFGSGFSDLHRASHLSPDIIKIDRSLLRAIDSCEKPLRHAISLAKELGALVVVEGVETEQELELVKGIGVDFVQGFYIGMPTEMRLLLADIKVEA
uniref:EAL domain-containing protein n=1 Tax=Thaumasiovibrio occultus TaxID=1891184 RepID=UPI00131E9C06|nr:EAL domain-containing protein [Thaumasiovibrio occultus]